MGWHQADPKNYAFLSSAVSVAVRVRDGKVRAHFVLGGDLVKQLRWRKGDRVQLHWGEGRDSGKCKLIRDRNGPGFSLQKIGASQRTLGFRTACIPRRANGAAHRAEYCKVELIEGGVKVILPDWFLPPVDYANKLEEVA